MKTPKLLVAVFLLIASVLLQESVNAQGCPNGQCPRPTRFRSTYVQRSKVVTPSVAPQKVQAPSQVAPSQGFVDNSLSATVTKTRSVTRVVQNRTSCPVTRSRSARLVRGQPVRNALRVAVVAPYRVGRAVVRVGARAVYRTGRGIVRGGNAVLGVSRRVNRRQARRARYGCR